MMRRKEVIAELLRAGRPDLVNQMIQAKTTEVKASAESAFEKELLPWLARQVNDLVEVKLDKSMLAIIKNGKWPDRRLEYAVMRHQQASDGQDFLENVMQRYLAWRRDLARKVSKL